MTVREFWRRLVCADRSWLSNADADRLIHENAALEAVNQDLRDVLALMREQSKRRSRIVTSAVGWYETREAPEELAHKQAHLALVDAVHALIAEVDVV